MYDYIKGTVEELNPAELVLECGGIGYKLAISLYSYEKFRNAAEAKAFVYHHVREDEETLYGFYDRNERKIFSLLISVSGVGPNTARMMLSSLSADDLTTAITTGDVNRIKSVKGIGLKTAQKIIIELKDRISKGGNTEIDLGGGSSSENVSEAISALIMLGFTKVSVEKVVRKITTRESGLTLEDIIKKALKQL